MRKKIDKLTKTIHKYIKKGLQYFRINDENNLVSLTNIAMIIMLYKIAATPSTSFEDLTALFVVIVGYQSKRFVGSKNNSANKAP